MTRKTSPAEPPAPEAGAGNAPNRMWGGRFEASPDEVMEAINASIDFDRRLYAEDIAGSIAHVTMLTRQGIVSQDDADAIADGLRRVQAEIEAGGFPFDRALEDIHMNIEARLAALIGPAAGRLHTARPRNDQGAPDLRPSPRARLGQAAGRAASTPRARATTRSRPTSGSGCARVWTRPTRRAAPFRVRSSTGPRSTRPRSCRVSPTFRWRSRSPSAITCWPMSR